MPDNPQNRYYDTTGKTNEQSVSSDSSSSSSDSSKKKSENGEEETAEDIEKKQQEEQEKEDEEDEEEFHAHRGKIMGIKPYTQISNLSWDKSYDNPTASGKVELHYPHDEREDFIKYVYKGVSCKVKLRRSNEKQFTPTGIEEIDLSEEEIVEREHYPTKEQLEEIGVAESLENLEQGEEKQTEADKLLEAEENKPYIRSDGDGGVYGFVTDVTHDSKGTELEIKDWGYCLEDNTKKLTFNNMPRSQIIEEVVKSYGLVPAIDFTGLKDDTISWTNVTGSGGSSSSDSGGSSVGEASDGRNQCSTVYDVLSVNQNDGGGTPINELMKDFKPDSNALGKIGQENTNYGKAVKGKTPKEAYKVLKNGWKYLCYCDNRDKCATESFENRKSSGINCGDSARLLKCAMDVVGCPCCVLHVTNHYMCAVQVNGEWKTADLCYSSGRHPEYNTAGFNK